MMTETGLHHDPVNCSGQIDVSGQKNNVLALERCDAFVGDHKMGHNEFEGSLPFAGGTRTWTQIWTIAAGVFVFGFFGVDENDGAAVAGVFAWEFDVRGDLFHGQVADVAEWTSACGTACEFNATTAADQMAGLALENGWQNVIEADGTFE